MAIKVQVGSDGYIHTSCPRTGCGTRFKIVPPRRRDHFHCPVSGCGCAFAIGKEISTRADRQVTTTSADDSGNVWEDVMDAIYAEQATAGTLWMRTRYPRSRRLAKHRKAPGLMKHWSWIAIRGGVVAAAALLFGLGALVGLLDSPSEARDPITNTIAIGDGLNADPVSSPATKLGRQSVACLDEKEKGQETVVNSLDRSSHAIKRGPQTTQPLQIFNTIDK
jgi:hypothetical protein